MKFPIYDGETLVAEWDDDNRVFINHQTGETRPYTEEENTDADARQAHETATANEAALLAGIEKVLARAADYQAKAQEIIDDTNQNINSSPAKYIKTLARGEKRIAGDIMRLARIAGRLYDSTDVGDES